MKKVIPTTLDAKDLANLTYILGLGSNNFSMFYDELEDHEQKYVTALLETYRLDILDYVYNLKFNANEKFENIFMKLKHGKPNTN